MKIDYISNIKNFFRNIALNAVGAERDLYQSLADKDVRRVLDMMEDNSKEVDTAISEYNPQTHKVMYRHDKDRRGKDPYISEKLPRTRQRYINEIELFFLLGKPIVWKKTRGEDEGYELYTDFLEETRFNTLIRKAKRLAGSETESAIIFHLTNDNGEIGVRSFVAARSNGYRLRTLFDQYGDLIALAYGYNLRENGTNVEHWDILTASMNFYCTKQATGWVVDTRENQVGKICAVYFRQPKAWDGAVPRIEREEMSDSRFADTNNYFSDPIASATGDVIESLGEPDTPGKMIRLTGSQSRFEYINPPQNSAMREQEKRDMKESILFDTFTPDFSYENMKGLGTLSGAAMHNALILGYIKRDSRIEIYGEMVGRIRNVIIAILKMRHPDKKEMLDNLRIEYEFAEPFDSDRREFWSSIANLYANKLVSLELAVQLLALTGAPDEEIERIRMAMMEEEQAKVDAQQQIMGMKEGVEPPAKTPEEEEQQNMNE